MYETTRNAIKAQCKILLILFVVVVEIFIITWIWMGEGNVVLF